MNQHTGRIEGFPAQEPVQAIAQPRTNLTYANLIQSESLAVLNAGTISSLSNSPTGPWIGGAATSQIHQAALDARTSKPAGPDHLAGWRPRRLVIRSMLSQGGFTSGLFTPAATAASIASIATAAVTTTGDSITTMASSLANTPITQAL